MKFCIATVTYWNLVGFDTSNWRKSIDGAMAIVHDEYAKVLVDIDNNPNVQVYAYPSPELDVVLNGSEWNAE